MKKANKEVPGDTIDLYINFRERLDSYTEQELEIFSNCFKFVQKIFEAALLEKRREKKHGNRISTK